jgi:tetratricopeptide (TPR) repeat protein
MTDGIPDGERTPPPSPVSPLRDGLRMLAGGDPAAESHADHVIWLRTPREGAAAAELRLADAIEAHMQGQSSDAVTTLEQTIEDSQRGGHPDLERLASAHLIAVLIGCGRFTQADGLLERVVSLGLSESGRVVARTLLIELVGAAGGSRTLLSERRAFEWEEAEPLQAAHLSFLDGFSLARAGRSTEAMILLEAARETLQTLNRPDRLLPCLDLMGRIHLAVRSYEQARQTFAQAVALAQRFNVPEAAADYSLRVSSCSRKLEDWTAAWQSLVVAAESTAGQHDQGRTEAVVAACHQLALEGPSGLLSHWAGQALMPVSRLEWLEGHPLRVLREYTSGTGRISLITGPDGSDQFLPTVLKTLRHRFVGDWAIDEALAREASVLLDIGWHPHIVELVEVVRLPSSLALYFDAVAPLLPRADAEHRATVEPPTPATAVRLVIECCDALAYAGRKFAERGLVFVHGDVSPRNVLVELAGTARLTDFGACRLFAALPGESSPARRIRVSPPLPAAGTPGFQSPESLDDETLMDPRSDVFSLGALLYWLCTGGPLFYGEPPRDTQRFETLLATADWHSPNGAPIDGLRDVVARCCQPKLEARYASLAEARAAFDALHLRLAGSPVLPTVVPPPDREELLARSSGLIAVRREHEALEYLEKLLEAEPSDGEAWRLTADALAHTQQRTRAERAFERAYRLSPHKQPSAISAAIFHMQAGRHAAAATWYRRAAESGPLRAAFRLNLGICLLESGELDEAEEELERAQELLPRTVSKVTRALTRLACKRGDPEVAGRLLDEAMRLGPDDVELMRLRFDVMVLKMDSKPLSEVDHA